MLCAKFQYNRIKKLTIKIEVAALLFSAMFLMGTFFEFLIVKLPGICSVKTSFPFLS